MPVFVLRDLFGQRRPRTDQAHVAFDHVEQLRQLVEAEAAEPSADARDPGIVTKLEHDIVDPVGRPAARRPHDRRPTRIVRNFIMVNGFPRSPIRRCRYSTGPGEVIFTAIAMPDEQRRQQEQQQPRHRMSNVNFATT